MTMHLIQGVQVLGKTKSSKITKRRLQELEVEWRVHNKTMKRKGMHNMSYDTLEEYIDYVFGRKKLKREFKPFKQEKTYQREVPHYPSWTQPANGAPLNPTPRKERPIYTGTLVKGIATMHKSNAVPVISQEQAEDISKMGR